MYFPLIGIDVNGPIFAGLGNYFKNIESIEIYGKAFYGHITNETFSDLHDYKNIRKLIISKTNIKTVDKESLHRLKDLEGKMKLVNTNIYVIFSKGIHHILCCNFALSEVAIDYNKLLYNLSSDLFSMLEKVKRVRIYMNNNLIELPSNLFDNLKQLEDLKLSGTSGTKLLLPHGLLNKT